MKFNLKNVVIVFLIFTTAASMIKNARLSRTVDIQEKMLNISDASMQLMREINKMRVSMASKGGVYVYKSDGEQCSYGFVGEQRFDIREIGVESVFVKSGSMIDLNCLNYTGEFWEPKTK